MGLFFTRNLPKVGAGVTFVLIGLFTAVPALAIEYGGIGGRPAYPRIDTPRSDSIFIHDISPGEVIKEGINVINNTRETKTLQVYAADSTPSTDGGFACKQLSETSTGVGTWIKLKKDTVTLNPVSSVIIPFTITVPIDVEIGEYNGCILIQEQKIPSSAQPGINLSIRTGLRVALTLPGQLVRILDLQDLELIRNQNGSLTLRSAVVSRSNVSVQAKVEVFVKDLFGRQIAQYGGNYSVLRGDKTVLNFEFKPPIWGGWFSAQTFLTYNDGQTDIQKQGQVLKFFIAPSLQAIIFVALAFLPLAILFILLKRRSNKHHQPYRHWDYYQVLPGDDLKSLAKKSGVSWKELVKANRLKPPYVIKPGTGLKIPPQDKSETHS